MLEYYLRKFSKLRVDRSKGSAAPHKPVLLLAIIQSIRCLEVVENRIFITPQLVARFKEIWSCLVKDDQFRSNFALPFYHMKSDGFWHLRVFPGREIVLTSSTSIRSFGHLRETIDHAYFNEDLFKLLSDSVSMTALERQILRTYFPNAGESIASVSLTLFNSIENKILNEPPILYRDEITRADEEEIFVRGGVFKKTIPRIYNYTCCISGMQVIAGNVQMVDACHIVPFAESCDDTISNGISLCPNLHRAYDRCLITIDENYKVIVSTHFKESENYSIKQYDGKQILLPQETKYRPALVNLLKHKKQFERLNG